MLISKIKQKNSQQIKYCESPKKLNTKPTISNKNRIKSRSRQNDETFEAFEVIFMVKFFRQ